MDSFALSFLFFCIVFLPSAISDICALSGKQPASVKYEFNLCRQYESPSCCLTGHDDDIQDKFSDLVDVGIACPYHSKNFAPALQTFWCMGCSPDQPKFMRGKQVLICAEFAEKLWGDGTLYDDCGLRLVHNNCGSGFDECGDDIIVPSVYFNSSLIAFMNRVAPPGLTSYTFISVTNDELGQNEKCFNEGNQQHVWLLLTLLCGLSCIFVKF